MTAGVEREREREMVQVHQKADLAGQRLEEGASLYVVAVVRLVVGDREVGQVA